MKTEAEAPITGLENQLGLTKREYFAGLFMASILTYSKNDITRIANDSVTAANALINALN